MTIKKISRFITVASLYLIPIFPLIVATPLFFPFITGKAFFFRILVEIAFAGWLLLCFLDAKYRPKLNAATICISLFALITLVADLLGVHPLRSLWSNFERMEGWITVIHLWAFFMVASNVFGHGEEGKVNWHRWFNFEIFIAVIVGIYGVVQLLGFADIHQGSSRIDASLGNAAYMAVYLLWNVGLTTYLFFVAKAKCIKNSAFLVWAYPILAVFFSFLLFETATRGTIIGWTGGIVVALLVYAFFAKGESKKSRLVSGGVVALIVILVISFYSMKDRSFIKNNEVLNRMASISLTNTESTARLYIWGMALDGAKDRPVLGWGQENFNYVFNTNYNPKLYNQEQWFDRAHSVYLDWLIASGLVGLLAYLSLYVVFLAAVWKSSLSPAMKAVLTGLLAGYAAHNLFVFDNLASYVLFFSALSFVTSFGEGKPFKFFGTKTASPEAVEYVVTPAIILGLVAILYFFNVRPIQANTSLIAALSNCGRDSSLFDKALDVKAFVANQEIREQMLSCAGQVIANQQIPPSTKNDYFVIASKAIDDQIASSQLKDARIYMLGGAFMNSAGQIPAATKLLEEAHKLSPSKQSIAIEYSLNLINSSQTEKAESILKKAYEDEPKNAQAKSMYALVLVLRDKEVKARELFGTDPEVFETIQMAQAYAMTKQYTKAVAVYKKLIAAKPDDVGLRAQLGQLQFGAGDRAAAFETFRSISKTHPEYADQIEKMIREAK